SIDFVSDQNPMKDNARKMISMLISINTNNFYYDKKIEPLYLNAVTCKTCHRGEPFPEVR
ncbi:MAG: photosynthetic reaction center cytochrome c subunit family protein, partial [Ferruginibacter sp.]